MQCTRFIWTSILSPHDCRCGPRIGWNSLWSLEPSQIPAPIYIILLPKIAWTLALEPFDMSLMSGPWCEPPKIHAQVTCTSECLRPMLIIIPSQKPYCQPATKLYNKLIFELSWTTSRSLTATRMSFKVWDYTDTELCRPYLTIWPYGHMACFHLVNWFGIYALQPHCEAQKALYVVKVTCTYGWGAIHGQKWAFQLPGSDDIWLVHIVSASPSCPGGINNELIYDRQFK